MTKFEDVAKETAKAQGLPVELKINTTNDFVLGLSSNLPNTSHAQRGQEKFVTSRTHGTKPVIFRTKQSAYRYVAWLLCFAEVLPDEEDQPGVTLEQIQRAIQTS